jgi:hypothetical protein
MRLARDLILVVCAIISTACLVYIAMHLDTASVEDTATPTARMDAEGDKSR